MASKVGVKRLHGKPGGSIFPQPNALIPSGPEEGNTHKRHVPQRGTFTTEKPRSHPCARGGRVGTRGSEQYTGIVHDREKEHAIAACDNTRAPCNAEWGSQARDTEF